MDFGSALERTIKKTQGNRFFWVLAMSAGFVVLAAIMRHVEGIGERPLIALIAAVCVWPVAILSESEGLFALKSLRGAEPEHWLASRSHGVVVFNREFILVGHLRVEFDPYARRRVTSAAYDEGTHTLLIGITQPVKTSEGVRAEQTIVDVYLETWELAKRASTFADKVRERCQR